MKQDEKRKGITRGNMERVVVKRKREKEELNGTESIAPGKEDITRWNEMEGCGQSISKSGFRLP